MSEKHTPGRLEIAVEVFDNDGCPETVIQGMAGAASVAVCLDFGDNNPGMRCANARRLVACWNAFEDVTTEQIEAGTSRNTAIAALRHLRDRGELLAALKEARRWIGDGECADGIPREYWTPEYIKIVDGIDAVIAKVEGGAA